VLLFSADLSRGPNHLSIGIICKRGIALLSMKHVANYVSAIRVFNAPNRSGAHILVSGPLSDC